ncbi:hypothetical protein SVAN01_10112 [Stagonosporopsis vannaccii]|nr:hypothetical protein SVAN01_10112 [Stagonosporopsis vannaccii]
MCASKRKWQSTDSAIADMSGEDLTSIERNIQNANQQEHAIGSQQANRCSSGCSTETLGLKARDFGTAASLRPCRSQTTPSPIAPKEAPQKRRKVVKDDSNDMPAAGASQEPDKEVAPLSLASEVKETPVEREITPDQDKAVAALPSPPKTLEKTILRSPLQLSLRRSARDRRPIEHLQDFSIEAATPCKKKPRKKTVGLTESQKETVRDRKSCIVRLRVPLAVIAQQQGQSMSLTGSFSLRRKGSDHDLDDSQVSAKEAPSFHDHGPEAFAQPQPRPILASSQDFDSSQPAPNDNNLTSYAAVQLQEYFQTSSSLPRERISMSSWISRQDQPPPLTPDISPQRHGDVVSARGHADDSWQTQPTVPLSRPQSFHLPSDDAASTFFHASQATTVDETANQFPSSEQTLSKQDLHVIADQLFENRTYGTPKPEPVGQPPVWADARMDLCETLHYFRSYQGACHSTGGFVRGFMFDKVAHPRDYTDSNVVIARAGGGQTRDKDSGELKATGDQVEGTVSQNLRNCMLHYNPVVIITGINNPHMPSQPPHQYCVLDYFKPTHIWSEKSDGSTIVRYRFEKLNARKDSWWRAKDVEDPVQLGSLPPPFSKACGTCAHESPQIYLNGWMCLQPTCGSFWLIFPSSTDYLCGSQPFEPDEGSLVYDPRFLKSHTPWPNDSHTCPLTFTSATTSSLAMPGEDTSEAFTRGVVCPCCKRCVPRLSWTGWECPCGWTRRPTHTLIPALSTRESLWPLSDAYTASRDTHSPLVSVHVDFAHGYRVNAYTLPGIDGYVVHMIANASVVAEKGGPDDMFEVLQREDIGLRRRPMEGGMLKGGMYTRHFCVNYGIPYKFIAATESHPFPAPPHPITTARERLDWAARFALSQLHYSFSASSHSPSTTNTLPSSPSSSAPDFSLSPHLATYVTHPFNEVLALGYFESQRISYHDDGESGLGPTIATLSLGSPGVMKLRLKAKHHLGVSNAGVYTDAPPLPGCVAHAARLALVQELALLKRSSAPTAYRQRLKEIPRELGLRRSGSARDVLTLRLGHGDVVVMHGKAVQRYYEHAVEHTGKLRFALTSRYIDPGSVAAADRPVDNANSDKEVESAEREVQEDARR